MTKNDVLNAISIHQNQLLQFETIVVAFNNHLHMNRHKPLTSDEMAVMPLSERLTDAGITHTEFHVELLSSFLTHHIQAIHTGSHTSIYGLPLNTLIPYLASHRLAWYNAQIIFKLNMNNIEQYTQIDDAFRQAKYSGYYTDRESSQHIINLWQHAKKTSHKGVL